MNKPLTALVILGKILLTAAIVFGLMVIVIIPIMLIVGAAENSSSLDSLMVSSLFGRLTLIAQNLCFIGAIAIMYVAFERKAGWRMGWKEERPMKSLLEGSMWGIVLMSAAFAVIWISRGLEIDSVQLGSKVISSLSYAIVVFALVAISEELVTRGYIQGLVKRTFGMVPAILVTSGIFAALHLLNANVLQNPIPVLNLFLAGVLLGVAREASGGLWLPIGLHFTWNLFQGNVFGFAVSGNDFGEPVINITTTGSDLISGGAFGAEGSLIATAILIGATVLFWRRVKQNEAEAERKLSFGNDGAGLKLD